MLHLGSHNLLPKFKIILDTSLACTIKIYKWLLPEDYETLKYNKRSIQNITASSLLNRLEPLHRDKITQ